MTIDQTRTPSRTVPPTLRAPALRSSALVAAVGVVLVLGVGVLLHGSAVDLAVTVAFNALHVGWIGAVTSAVYAVFSPVGAIALTVVAAAVIWASRRDVRPAAAFAAVVAGTWLPSAAVKLLVDRSRPDLAQLPHPLSPAQVDASYPSGHAVFVTVAAVATLILLADLGVSAASRAVAAVVATVGVLVVLVSLLVDGVHFPTDVLASVVWALGVAPFVRAVWLRGVAARVPFLR